MGLPRGEVRGEAWRELGTELDAESDLSVEPLLGTSSRSGVGG